MTPNIAFTFDVLFSIMGLFYIIYISYGRTKQKPIISIGNFYKPKGPGHASFLKVVNSNFVFTITILATLLAVASLVFDTFRVLEQPPSTHSIFVVAPIGILALSIIVFFTVSRILQDK